MSRKIKTLIQFTTRGNHACKNNSGDVGDNRCHGTEDACEDNSCLGENVCVRNDADVDDNSCIGARTCVKPPKTGPVLELEFVNDNSCIGARTCKCLSSSIGDNECISADSSMEC